MLNAMIFPLYLFLQLIVIHTISASENQAFWTLDHEHDIRCGIQKMRQVGFSAFNDTDQIIPITLRAVGNDHKMINCSKVIYPNEGVTFNPSLTYIDIARTHYDEEPFSTEIYTNLVKNSDKYDIRFQENPRPFIPYGDPNFKFGFKWIEKKPVPQDTQSERISMLKKTSPSPLYNMNTNSASVQPNEPIPQQPQSFQASSKATAHPKAWNHWSDQYNGNVWFLEERTLKPTGITRDKYTQILNDAYKKHSPSKMFDFLKEHPIRQENYKIQPITNTIWFTHPDKPVEFPEIYVDSLKRTAKACPSSQGFKHLLWVLDKTYMPETVKAFKGSNIEILEVAEFGHYRLKNFVEEAVYKQRKMGLASDAFRAVVQQKGGIYKDSDYEFRHSIAPWLTYYDFVGNMEPMSSYIGNALFMNSQGHPITNLYVDNIERNGFDDVPQYIKDVLIQDKAYATIAITGPGALTEAVAVGLGKRGRTDVILPHQFFYPSETNSYPELDVHKHHELPLYDISWGIHYWHTTWDKKQYGSVG